MGFSNFRHREVGNLSFIFFIFAANSIFPYNFIREFLFKYSSEQFC